MWQKVAKFKGAEYFRKALYMYIFSFNPLDLCVFGSCWESLDSLLDITALLELEAQHFATLALTSANHAYVTNNI